MLRRPKEYKRTGTTERKLLGNQLKVTVKFLIRKRKQKKQKRDLKDLKW